jgi:hypothetical protein
MHATVFVSFQPHAAIYGFILVHGCNKQQPPLVRILCKKRDLLSDFEFSAICAEFTKAFDPLGICVLFLQQIKLFNRAGCDWTTDTAARHGPE